MNVHLISKRLQSYAKAASIALWVSFIVWVLFYVQDAVVIYMSVNAPGLLKEPILGSASFEDLVLLVSLWSASTTYFVGVVTFIVWFEYVYRNLPLPTGSPTNHSRWMALVGWFLPFIAFVVPYQMTREIWGKLSERQQAGSEMIGRPSKSKSLVSTWWGFHLASVYVLPATSLALWNVYPQEKDWTSFLLGLATGWPGFVTALLEIQVIRRITALYLPLLQASEDSQSGVCIAPPPKPASPSSS